uniref:sugar transferase n=1 Tax=Clostridium sp. 12(A) TaxID=1163671 RepID=UPI000467362F|nr:sugar transferase [Clostridium sp. 12(A)]
MYQKRKTIENILISFIDIICIWISTYLAFAIRYGLFLGINKNMDNLWQIIIITLLYVLVIFITNTTRHFFRRGCLDEIGSVIRGQSAFSILWVVTLFLIHRSSELSRLLYGYFIIISVVFIFIGRMLFKLFMLKIYKTSKYSNRLLVVTTTEKVEGVIKNFIEYNEWNRIITGIALIDKSLVGEAQCGMPVVADKETIIDYVVHHNVDEVFINDTSAISNKLLEQWVAEMKNMGIIVDVNIDIFDIKVGGKKTLNRVGKYSVVTFARNIFSNRQVAAKRILDIIGSLVGIIILCIVTIFIAPLIKLESPGPAFFGQTRIGKNGRKFTFYKFRSMYQDAEHRKKELMKENEVKGLMFKLENDPRITHIGRFIRKTSIDELPQFWNVLRGDMSLVGTRPPTVDEYERYETKHKCRLSMTPGLTGLWQISGRSDIKDFDEVVKLDMQYIDDWSILKDIKILILTIWVVLTGKGSR